MTMAASAAALALAAAPPAGAAAELVTNGGFETGNFSGWNVGYTAGNNICCYNFTGTGANVQAAGSNFGAALAGAYSAFGDWDGGDPSDYNEATDFWIRQLITKASDVTSATLTFSFNVAGGAYKSYENAYQGYDEVLKRNVTANFLGTDLSLASNLYTFERPLLLGNEPYVYGVQNVTLDVTTAFNTLGDGQFYLDIGRHIPQYFTGAGYFVLDNVSLQVGEAVVDPVGGIPEPASWALMILGFGGAGAMLRRRLPAVA